MENFLGLLVRVCDPSEISEYLAGFDRMSKSLRHDKIDVTGTMYIIQTHESPVVISRVSNPSSSPVISSFI